MLFTRQLLRQNRLIFKQTLETSTTRVLPISRQYHQQPIPLRPLTALPPRLGRRWQSTETAKDASSSAASTEAAPEDAKDESVKKELEQKNREVIDLKDKYLRSVADFRNLQDRTKRDMESARQFAIQRFATDLLDSIDNLDRALGSVPPESLNADSESPSATSNMTSTDSDVATDSSNRDLLNLHAGLRMTESILMSTLKKHGLERFDPMEGEGRRFDPRLDEATFFTKVEGKENGEVFHTQSKGFTLNGRVIRPAKVGVVKNS